MDVYAYLQKARTREGDIDARQRQGCGSDAQLGGRLLGSGNLRKLVQSLRSRGDEGG